MYLGFYNYIFIYWNVVLYMIMYFLNNSFLNFQILLYPDWVKINSVLRVKKPDLFIVNSQTENNNFHSNVCCQIGESIQVLKHNYLPPGDIIYVILLFSF